MAVIKLKGDKSSYKVRDADCLARSCLQLGHYQVRGGTLSGSRNTGSTDACCMRRAYHGCPSPGEPEVEIKDDLRAERKAAGMKASY